MTDKRWNQLAEILVNYSTGIKRSERVLITMMEVETFPLARAVYAEAVKAGGLPYIEFQSAYLEHDLMKFGGADQINWVSEMQSTSMQWADVYIGLRGARNPSEFWDIDREVLVAHKKVMGEISALRNKETRWVLVRVPNESFAQQAQTSLDEIMDFFFRATIKDWSKETERYKDIVNIFQAAQSVRITGEGTDLSFSTSGRLYELADGHYNMPDGEIFTSPVDDSADGIITFEFPGVYAGNLIEGICLQFSRGKVVHAAAKKNEALLLELLDMDQGAQRIGEFGIGVNPGIDRFCYDILYDEKIGGTIHIALGRAYQECNGINQSALHWDIIKDLRTNGVIYLDSTKVFENGKYLVKS